MSKKDQQNDLEQRLLSNASLDELIKIKMEEEMNAEFKKIKKNSKKELITEISKVPKALIFSKKAIYRVFNRIHKTETYINGLQAESMLGLQHAIKAKLVAGEISAFSTEDVYVKFENAEYQSND